MSDSKRSSFFSHLTAAFRNSNFTYATDSSSDINMLPPNELKKHVTPKQDHIPDVTQQTLQHLNNQQPCAFPTNPYHHENSEISVTDGNATVLNKELHEQILNKINEIKAEQENQRKTTVSEVNRPVQNNNIESFTTKSSAISKNENILTERKKKKTSNDSIDTYNNFFKSTFFFMVDYKNLHGTDISLEELLAESHKTLKTLLEAVDDICNKILFLQCIPTDVDIVKKELNDLKSSLTNFNTKGNQRIMRKIEKAVDSLKDCHLTLNSLPVKTDEVCVGALPVMDNNIDVQTEIPNIVINVLIAQRKAREDMQKVKTELEKQLSVYKTKLESLNISADNPQLAQARNAALDMCANVLPTRVN